MQNDNDKDVEKQVMDALVDNCVWVRAPSEMFTYICLRCHDRWAVNDVRKCKGIDHTRDLWGREFYAREREIDRALKEAGL